MTLIRKEVETIFKSGENHTSPCISSPQYVVHTHSDDLNTDDDDDDGHQGQVPHTGRFPLAKAEFKSKLFGFEGILVTHHPDRF